MCLHPTQLQWQDHLARNLFERPDDFNPTVQQWLTVEDPDGQTMWIRKHGATRGSAPFVIDIRDWSHEQEEDFDL
eukprot:11021610-Prorocentrum_lima.AAC.1